MTTAQSIRLDKVVKCFGDHRVVDEIDLTIDPGEIFFLLGPSGCGKTTLLRCIAGFYKPESGRIVIGDRDVTQLAPEDRDTGMVFQSYALWPHMTVRENVSFGLELRKVSKSDMAERVDQALAAVRMTDRADYRPNQLSGGQQQRIALARALVVRPACLLLDEPLSNLDAKLRLEMRIEIRRICKEAGLTAVYVTHDQKEALSIADRIAVLHDGRVHQCAEPETIYKTPASRFVADFIGETNFLPGKVQALEGDRMTLETDIGPIVSTNPPDPAASVGDEVTVSVRPEVIHLGDVPASDTANCFDCEVHDTQYLGEIAQHSMNIATHGDAPPRVFSVFDMNPKFVARDDSVQSMKAWFREENVIVLTR